MTSASYGKQIVWSISVTVRGDNRTRIRLGIILPSDTRKCIGSTCYLLLSVLLRG